MSEIIILSYDHFRQTQMEVPFDQSDASSFFEVITKLLHIV